MPPLLNTRDVLHKSTDSSYVFDGSSNSSRSNDFRYQGSKNAVGHQHRSAVGIHIGQHHREIGIGTVGRNEERWLETRPVTSNGCGNTSELKTSTFLATFNRPQIDRALWAKRGFDHRASAQGWPGRT